MEASTIKALREARHHDPEVHAQCERHDAQCRCRSGHAAALRAARRHRPQQSALRLRARPVRRLHGAHGRPGDPLLHHAGVVDRRRQDRDARRPRHAGEAAPAADRLYRGASAAMRLLHQRPHHDGRCFPRQQEEADRRRDQDRRWRASSAAAAPMSASSRRSSAPPR